MGWALGLVQDGPTSVPSGAGSSFPFPPFPRCCAWVGPAGMSYDMAGGMGLLGLFCPKFQPSGFAHCDHGPVSMLSPSLIFSHTSAASLHLVLGLEGRFPFGCHPAVCISASLHQGAGSNFRKRFHPSSSSFWGSHGRTGGSQWLLPPRAGSHAQGRMMLTWFGHFQCQFCSIFPTVALPSHDEEEEAGQPAASIRSTQIASLLATFLQRAGVLLLSHHPGHAQLLQSCSGVSQTQV